MSDAAGRVSAVPTGKGRTPAPVTTARQACECGRHPHASCGGLIQRCAEHGGDPGCACGVADVVQAPGQPLQPAVRADMEQRFGADFSRVRVHTDASAGASARRLNAHAYTVGRHVAFAPGRYAPETGAGRRTLAHELAHVLQQNGAPTTPRRLAVSAPGDADERAADAIADAVIAGRPVRPPAVPSAPRIARQAADTCFLGHYDGQGELVPSGEGGGDAIYYRVWGTWRQGEDLPQFGQRIFRAWVPWRFGPLPEDVRRKVMDHIYRTVLQKRGHGVGNAGCDYWIAMDKATLARVREISGEVQRERQRADAVAAEKAAEKGAGRTGETEQAKATVDQRLAMLEGRIRQTWTGGGDEEAILQILDGVPAEQAAELSRRLATDRIGEETFLDALDRVVDLGNNMELHAKLTALHLRALGPEAGLAAAEKAPILPWHDVMGLFEQSATFSATRGAGGKITIKYHQSSSLLNSDAPFAGELNALPFDVKVGGKAYDPEQLFKVHDWDEGRFVTLRARDLVAFTHVGKRKFYQDVATVASLVTPIGAARTAVGKAAVITMERVLPLTVLLIDENRLNLVKWFPTWGPRMVQFSDFAKVAMGAYGLAQFARSGVGFFRAWKATRNARRVWEAANASPDAERAAAQIEKEADELFAAAERFQQAEAGGQAAGPPSVRLEDMRDFKPGVPANDTTSWLEALEARKAAIARQAEEAAAAKAVGELDEADAFAAGTGTDGQGVRMQGSGGSRGGKVSPPPPLPSPPNVPKAAPLRPAEQSAPPRIPAGVKPRKIEPGVGRGSGTDIERRVIEEYRRKHPLSRETPDRFVLHEPIVTGGGPENSFNRIAGELERRFAQLRASGKPAPRLNLDVLEESTAGFIARRPDLKADFDMFAMRQQRLLRLSPRQRTPGENAFIRDFNSFLGSPKGVRGPVSVTSPARQAGAVGRRRPDIVHFKLDRGSAAAIDATGKGRSDWHQFKSRFYQHVLKEMLPDLDVRAVEAGETTAIDLGVLR